MHRWKHSALAAAAAAALGLYSSSALALALGPISVQSALGEPLRAEIDLPQATASEAETLRVTTAAPETYRAQGMEYSPLVTRVQIEIKRRPNGSAVLRLTSDRPVTEPFVDLVIDANWNTGRLTRSYTMLFDPPTLRKPPVAVAAMPEAPAARPAPAQPQRAPQVSPPAASAPATAAGTEHSVTVKAGDTAGRIASAHRPAGVSLDQMLVALLRANPDAFIQGNVNRIKAGAVLQMPGEAQASAIDKAEARQVLAAQSRDFSDFRRKLAGAAPAVDVGAAGRSAKGTVEAQVQDQKAGSAAPDKLTLSKGALKERKANEEALAQRKQAQQAAARVEELAKNIEDLNKLSAASGAATAPAAVASAPGIAVPVAAPPVPAASEAQAPASEAAAAPAQPASEAASAPEPAASAAEAASAPAAVAEAASVAQPAAPRPVPPAAPPVEEPGFLDGLLDDPMMPLAGGGLLALLLGYGAYRVVQRRRNNAGMDSSFLESRLQPDSFFGASGGQRIDTANTDSSTGGSSMAYSPSQLDAGGDVDPVAEADVYLAYGRDLQAEEILKEALRHNPGRVSIHAKLAEIYAKRQDRKALESAATQIHQLTQGQGQDWARVADLGRTLDPDNALYQPGGAPAAAGSEGIAPSTMPPDLDLDLDLDLPDDALTDAPAAPAGAFAAAAESAAAPVLEDSAPMPLEIPDYESPAAPAAEPVQADEPPLWQPPVPASPAPAAMAAEPPGLLDVPLDMPLDAPLDLPDIDTQPNALEKPAEKPYVPSESGLMDFDLDSISLDLKAPPASPAADSAPAEPTTARAELPGDPLATKLALAQEFHAIGDTDGARTLIEEVMAEASGDLKARAQKMLADFS